MRVLFFEWGNHLFKVKEDGALLQSDGEYNEWDCKWEFLGVSYHHWKRGIDVPLKEAFENPQKLKKGRVWDRDHGTWRRWEGGKITQAWMENI